MKTALLALLSLLIAQSVMAIAGFTYSEASDRFMFLPNGTIGSSGTPFAWADLYSFDLATPRQVLDNTTCGLVGNVSRQVLASDSLGVQLYMSTWNGAGVCSGTTWTLTGKDAWGDAQVEVVNVPATPNWGSAYSTKNFSEITNITIAVSGKCTCEANQSRIGNVWKLDNGRAAYQIDANIYIGNSTTAGAAFLNSTDTSVFFSQDKGVYVTTYSSWQQGLLNSTTLRGSRGGTVRFFHTSSEQFFVEGGGALYWYGVRFEDAGRTSYCKFDGTTGTGLTDSIIRWTDVTRNDLVPSDTLDDQCPRAFTSNIALNYVTIIGGAQGIEINKNPSYNFNYITVSSMNSFGFVNAFGTAASVWNTVIDNCSKEGREVFATNELNLTNSAFNISNFAFLTETGSHVREKYTINITMQTPLGTSLPNVNCTLRDKLGVVLWSYLTNANGNLYDDGTQVAYANSSGTYSLTPLNFYCSAAGYASYNSTWNSVKKPIEMSIALPFVAIPSNAFFNRETRVVNGTTLKIRAQFNVGDAVTLSVRNSTSDEIWTGSFPASTNTQDAAKGLYERDIQFNCSSQGYGDWYLVANTSAAFGFIAITCDHYSIDDTYLVANQTNATLSILLAETRANFTTVSGALSAISLGIADNFTSLWDFWNCQYEDVYNSVCARLTQLNYTLNTTIPNLLTSLNYSVNTSNAGLLPYLISLNYTTNTTLKNQINDLAAGVAGNFTTLWDYWDCDYVGTNNSVCSYLSEINSTTYLVGENVSALNTSLYNLLNCRLGVQGEYSYFCTYLDDIEGTTSTMWAQYQIDIPLIMSDISDLLVYATFINQTAYWHYYAFNHTTFGTGNLSAYDVWNYIGGRNLTWLDYSLLQTYAWNATDRNLTWYPQGGSSNFSYADFATLGIYIWNTTDRNLTFVDWLLAANYTWNHTSALESLAYLQSINYTANTTLLQYLLSLNYTTNTTLYNLLVSINQSINTSVMNLLNNIYGDTQWLRGNVLVNQNATDIFTRFNSVDGNLTNILGNLSGISVNLTGLNSTANNIYADTQWLRGNVLVNANATQIFLRLDNIDGNLSFIGGNVTQIIAACLQNGVNCTWLNATLMALNASMSASNATFNKILISGVPLPSQGSVQHLILSVLNENTVASADYIKVELYNPDGGLFNTTNATNHSDGTYHWTWELGRTQAKGVYSVVITAVKGSYKLVGGFAFKIVSEDILPSQARLTSLGSGGNGTATPVVEYNPTTGQVTLVEGVSMDGGSFVWLAILILLLAAEGVVYMKYRRRDEKTNGYLLMGAIVVIIGAWLVIGYFH